MKRNTYLKIKLDNISYNINKLISTFDNYEYYFGVVKANCYGCGDITLIKNIINNGCNYLAVATLDEALYIRKEIKDIPILCLGVIPSNYIELCKKENITVTINSLNYLNEIIKYDIKDLKIHIKINTGMNRLGINDNNELKKVIEILKQNNILIDGVYTHIYNASNKTSYEKQLDLFKTLIYNNNLNNIKIIHMSQSEAMVNYSKPDFVNGCRLGIIMYGFNDKMNLKSVVELCSEVIQIHTLKKGETVGYNAKYTAMEDNEKIAVIPIGYRDGIIRANSGRYVFINNNKYYIVGNICMDMLFVKVDSTVKEHNVVYLLKDNNHIKYVSNYLNTIPYEILTSIGDRVYRIYE